MTTPPPGAVTLLTSAADLATAIAADDPLPHNDRDSGRGSDHGSGTAGEPGSLRVGIDLGTASCVLAVLSRDTNSGQDENGRQGQLGGRVDRPVWVASIASGALRDGVVVDFARATATIRQLKEHAEAGLGVELTAAATAYPPCIPVKDARACSYVCESAGFTDVTLVDEVTAAQRTLEVCDGVVVDVGGGSTGVGVFRGGELVALDDRAGGGHHLDLMLAGALGIPLEDAEPYKRSHPRESFPVLIPGLQRIAENIRALTVGHEDLPLHIAGGALMISGAENVLAKYLERTVVTYPHALLITPLGIARSAERAAR